MVEAAFVLPILFFVTFGIIEFGNAYQSLATTKSATRSGARVAAAEYAAGNVSQSTAVTDTATAVKVDLSGLSMATPQEMWIYKAGTNGHPSGDTNWTSCSSNCIALTWNTNNNTWNSSTGTWTSPNACTGTADMIGVYVKTFHNYRSKFFGSGVTIRQFTVMRLEPKVGTCS